MKKIVSSRNVRDNRISSSPIFYTSTFSKNELINKELDSLNTLSKLIKSFQIEFLSSNNEKEETDFDYNYTIKNLGSLKNLLIDSLKIELEEKNFLVAKVILFFIITQNEENIKITEEINVKNKKKESENEQLKNLNFTIKNEINKIDDLIIKIKEDTYILQKIHLFQEENKEIYCKNSNEIALAENQLRFKKEILKRKYNKILSITKEKENEINELKEEIERIKQIGTNHNFHKKYIDTENIIEEVSENNNYSSFFNSKKNDSKNKEDSSYKDNKNKIKNIKRNSDNYLNMNINVNINVNNEKNYENKLSNTENKFKIPELNIIPKPQKNKLMSNHNNKSEN